MYVKITVNNQNARAGVISTQSDAAGNVRDLGNGAGRAVGQPAGKSPERCPSDGTATRIDGWRGIEVGSARAAHVVGRSGRIHGPALDVVVDERINVVGPRIEVFLGWRVRSSGYSCRVAILVDGTVRGDGVRVLVAGHSWSVCAGRRTIAIIVAVYLQITLDGDWSFRCNGGIRNDRRIETYFHLRHAPGPLSQADRGRNRQRREHQDGTHRLCRVGRVA